MDGGGTWSGLLGAISKGLYLFASPWGFPPVFRQLRFSIYGGIYKCACMCVYMIIRNIYNGVNNIQGVA